jgi:hypothetical protein
MSLSDDFAEFETSGPSTCAGRVPAPHHHGAAVIVSRVEVTRIKGEEGTAYEHETACFVLSPNTRFRRALFWLVKWPWYQSFIILSILVNSALFGAYNPLNPASNNAQDVTEPLFLAIFASEAIVKLLAMGVWLHKDAYFRDGWNW